MIIISHRGWWKEPSEKNKKTAFERSLSAGFGIETDVRDYHENLVISHDIADSNSMPLSDFFKIYKRSGTNLPLALNIKADGLQYKLKQLLLIHKIENYFLFDMSIPDTINYFKQDNKIFVRQSEIEAINTFYNKADGVWLDELYGHWITQDIIKEHVLYGKKVCIVSPELHNREYSKEWLHYKEIEKSLNARELMLCTDYPEKAEEFFNEQ